MGIAVYSRHTEKAARAYLERKRKEEEQKLIAAEMAETVVVPIRPKPVELPQPELPVELPVRPEPVEEPKPRLITPQRQRREIIDIVLARIGTSFVRINVRARSNETVFPRQIVMWFTRSAFGVSLPEVGRMFDRDHTTALHAYRHIDAMFRDGVPEARQKDGKIPTQDYIDNAALACAVGLYRVGHDIKDIADLLYRDEAMIEGVVAPYSDGDDT